MQNSLRAVSLAFLLFSPGFAQDQAWQLARQHFPSLQAVEVMWLAQASPQEEANAFDNSKYTFWDAKVLAAFWNQNLSETKARIGRKLLWGGQHPVLLDQTLQDARALALGSVDQLRLFRESGYTFSDAADLARLWGDPSPWGAKKWIETQLITGAEQAVKDELRRSRSISQPPAQPDFLTNLVGSRWTYNHHGRALGFTFGQTTIDNFSNGWWPGVSWQPNGVNQLRFWDTPNNRAMTVRFDSADSFSGNDWDGSPISGTRLVNTPTPPAPPPVRPTFMQVSNLQSGEILGSRFNVSGQGVPGSQVLVVVEYPKQDLVSQISRVMLRFQSQATVGKDGLFSVPVNAQEVPRGQPMTITVSDTANSPILSLIAEKGADHQPQRNPGASPRDGSKAEVFYDRQNNFGLTIPKGWMQVLPGQNEVLKLANGAGSTLAVGVGPAKDPQLVVNSAKNELLRRGLTVSQADAKLGGLASVRLDTTSGQGERGIVIICVTGRNQTFVVAIENVGPVTSGVSDMLNSFLINAR